MEYNWALDFVQNSSLVPLYIEALLNLILVASLFLFHFLFFFIFKRKGQFGGNPKLNYDKKYNKVLFGFQSICFHNIFL
jgi:hypothetical protein